MLATGRAEGMPGTEPLPAEAAETLYVDNMPMDVNRREMSHVFRPFEGFKVTKAYSATPMSVVPEYPASYECAQDET